MMDIQAYLTPWNIGGGVAGLVLSVAIIISLVLNRRQCATVLKQASDRLFSQIGFFSLVIVIFLIISVLESGGFFNANITHGAIFGLLGYALALGFDLVSVVCMLARLNAQRMRDEQGNRLNLLGVIICAAVSAFANAAGSLQGYNPIDLDHTPAWMQVSAPWLGMVFPALIVVLSMTTDHILDHAPARGVDVDTFRAREQKRVDLLQVRLDTERDFLKLESELATLRRNREQDSGHVQREWIIWHWLRPAVPVHSNITKNELKTEIDQAIQTMRIVLEERVEELRTTLRTQETQVSTWTTEVDKSLRTLGTQVEQIQAHMGTLAISSVGISTTQKPDTPDGQSTPTAQSAPTRRGRMPMLDNQGGTVGSDAEPEEQGSTAGSLLATFQRLGASTPDAKIAREVGCSRRTVARWRKRFQEQGLLSAVAQSEEPQPLLKKQ